MAGVKAPPRTTQLFLLTCWPMGQKVMFVNFLDNFYILTFFLINSQKVPSSTNSLVELMNMVERWRQRTDYGPVCIVSP